MSFCVRRSAIVTVCFAIQGEGFAITSVGDSYIATWKDNAKAAYSLSSDDCHPSEVYTIAPALTERGLHGTFYVNPGPNNWPWNYFGNVGDVNGDGKPDGWLHLPEQGHELAGHTLYHYSVVHGLASPANPGGTFATYDDLNADLVQTNTIIQNLTGQRVVSFAYPYGYLDAPSEAVVMQNYLSARSLIHEYPLPGTNTFIPNPATPPDMAPSIVSMWKVCNRGRTSPTMLRPGASFTKMLSDTVAAGGWGIEFFHQTGDDYTNANYYGDFSNIDRNAYFEHLDRIVNNVQSGNVWEDTVGNVTRYVDSRKAAAITYDSNSSAAIQLRVNDNLDHGLFNEPLTINTVIPDDWAASLSITDNGQPVTFKTYVDAVSGSTYATYDVIADGNPIVLTHNSGIVIYQPGDYNQDGIVDSADYTIWRDSLGSSSNLAADGDGDGIIGQGDYDVWVAHFGLSSGRGAGSAASTGSSVPEPSAAVLSATALVWIATLYRRRAER